MLGSNVALLIGISVLCLMGNAEAEAVDEERNAVRVDATYAGELLREQSGGLRIGTRYLDGLGLSAAMDGEQLIGLSGVSAYFKVVHGNGETISDLSGSRQSVTGIEGTSATRVPELWFEQSFGSRTQSLRFGLYDIGSEFDRIEAASLFFNQSQTMSPEFSGSGTHGPSAAPATGLGLRYGTQVGAWSGRVAVLDGDPGAAQDMNVRVSHKEGALIANEIDYIASSGLRLGSGYWRYTARFVDLRSTDSVPRAARNDNDGAFAFIEAPLHEGRAGEGLRWSARFGLADPRINEVARSYGMGLIYSASSQRPLNLGVAAGIAELGAPARFARAQENLPTVAREYSYEVSAAWQVIDSVMLKADVQHIVHPDMNPTLAPAWIFGFHFEVARQWRW